MTERLGNVCLNDDIFTDPCALSLPLSQRARWYELCRLAARQKRRGVIPPIPGAGLARALGTYPHILGRVLGALEGLGLVERPGDGSICVPLLCNAPAEAIPAAPDAPGYGIPADDRSAGARRTERYRAKNQAKKGAGAGSGQHNGNGHHGSNGASPRTDKASHNVTSVTPGPSHNPDQASHKASQGSVTRWRQIVTEGVTNPVTVPRARKSFGDVNVNVSEESEIAMQSSFLGDVNVNVPGDVTADVTPQASQQIDKASQNVTSSASSAFVPPSPSFTPRRVRPADMALQRRTDVTAVVELTGDDGSKGNWISLWKHCESSGRLDLWDEALQSLARKLGDGEKILSRGATLNSTLRNMLSNAGVPAPVNAALVDDVRAQIRASLATADAQSGGGDAGAV